MKTFCTCKDTDCKLHPINHDNGCDLCIKKNLANKEIPSCFFRLASDKVEDMTDFSFESFANIVLN